MTTPIDKYLSYISTERRYSPRTAEIYADVLERFRAWAGLPAADIVKALTLGDIRDYQIQISDKEKLGARTIGQHMSVLSGFCSYLVRQGQLESNPVKLVGRPKIPKRLPSFYRESSMEEYFGMTNSEIPAGAEGAQYKAGLARLVIDLPIADLRQWRSSYETLLDARMELEQYTKRLQELRKSAGKSPLDWEKELDVREVAYVASDSYRINLVRTGKSTKQDGIQDYPWAGFARALYGAPFCSDDVCSLRIGAWIISGSREALESLLQDASPVESEATEGFKGSRKWPSRVTAAVQTRHFQVFWTKNNTTIWQDSNL